MNKEVAGAISGTALSAIGTGMQTSEVLQIISLVLTIIGSLITIAMAVMNWWKKASADGKITKEELDEGLNIAKEGKDALSELIEKEKEGKGK